MEESQNYKIKKNKKLKVTLFNNGGGRWHGWSPL